RFALELGVGALAAARAREDLERDGAIERLVVALVDDAHAALAEAAEDAVAAELLGERRGGAHGRGRGGGGAPRRIVELDDEVSPRRVPRLRDDALRRIGGPQGPTCGMRIEHELPATSGASDHSGGRGKAADR